MLRSLLGPGALGAVSILAAASCVPVAPPRAAAVRPIARDEARLLRRLALIPPDADGAGAPLQGPPAALTAFVGAPAFTPATRSADDAERALGCLTAAVYHEARSEPVDGQRAVAQVVLNRVRDRAFPASVCGVVYQRSATVCQFSFACDGSTARPRDPAAWGRAEAIAQAAFAGEVYAPVGASTHFHTTSILPWWAPSLARIGRIGAHVFYGWRHALAGALTFRQAYAGVEPGAGPLPTPFAPAAAPMIAGVTIHRGNAAPAADPAAAPAPAAAAAPAPRAIYTAGVQIHRKATRPVTEGGHDALIGPEEMPMEAGAI